MNILFLILALFLAPLFIGIINQTKAFFAGRKGSGFFRLYFDLAKLLRKSCPRSTTSTWLFDIAPSATLATTLIACAIFPWSPSHLLATTVALPLFFYLLATGRFFTVLAALDTGSAFEGMGASREMQFSSFAELIIFVILGFLVLLTDCSSLSLLAIGYNAGVWSQHAMALVLIAIAFFAVFLSETSRVPFDDPETHLELTMIHEAMILDNSGPDLAFILYGAALKFELLAAFLVAILLPDLATQPLLWSILLFGGIFALAIIVGITESVIARMRFLKTPRILLASLMLATLATVLFILF